MLISNATNFIIIKFLVHGEDPRILDIGQGIFVEAIVSKELSILSYL